MMNSNKLLSISALLIAASIVVMSMMFWSSKNGPGSLQQKDDEIEKLKAENLELSKAVDSLRIKVEISEFVIDKYETCVMLFEEESKDCWIKFDSIYKNHE